MSTKLFAAGRLHPEKGFQYLIDALPEVLQEFPDTTLEIAGSGAFKESLEGRIETLGLKDHVNFLGFIKDPAELEKRYKDADVMVHPSLDDNEPYTILDAMRYETPVVATSVGGVPDLIEDGVSGILVPSKDAHALAEGITQGLRDRERLEGLADAAYQRAKTRFSIETTTSALLALYRDVLNPNDAETKTDGPEVSVVVPTYNRKDTVGRTIDSLLNQTFDGQYEIVVVDDGSADGTFEHLQSKYEAEIRSGKVNVLRKENGGVSSARNYGIDSVQGEFVAFIDSDDTALPNYLSELRGGFNDRTAMVHGRTLFQDQNGVLFNDSNYTNGIPNDSTHWGNVWNHITRDANTIDMLLGTSGHSHGNPVNAQTVMVRRRILEQMKARSGYVFDTHVHFSEDFDLWKRIASYLTDIGNQSGIGFVDNNVARYTHGNGHSFVDAKRFSAGLKAVNNKRNMERKFGKRIPRMLIVGGDVGREHYAKMLLSFGVELYKQGMTNVDILSQPAWFGGRKRYALKHVDNNSASERFNPASDRFQGREYWQTGWSFIGNDAISALKKVDPSNYDVVLLWDNRAADDVEHFKASGTKIVYRVSSLLKHEMNKEPWLDYNVVNPGDPTDETILRKQKKLLEAADLIEVQTPQYAVILSQNYPQYADKIGIIGGWTDWTKDEFSEIELRKGEPNYENLLSVGRLDPVKGHPYTIRALQYVVNKHPGVQLNLAGGSNTKGHPERLAEIARELNLTDNVIFHGNVSHDRLVDLYVQAGIYLQPSLHEQCPTTMINAAMAGIPIITSNIPEMRALVSEDSQTGFTARLMYGEGSFMHPDPRDIASKINYLIEHPTEGIKIGLNGQRELSKHNWENVVNNAFNNYRRLLI